MTKWNNINKVPIILYSNAEKSKYTILKENQGKSGIYCWKNKLNNKIYIGSAKDLTRRLGEYFNPQFLKRKLLKSRSRIYSSILKYDYNNFSLSILEYCELNKLIIKEQYYLDLLQPKYNICQTAYSSLGRKHSPETLLKFKNRKFTLETLAKMREAKLGKSPSPLAKVNHLLATSNITIIINKQDNSIKQYSSIKEAAKDLNVHHSSLLYCMKNNTLFKNTYLIIRFFNLKKYTLSLDSLIQVKTSISYIDNKSSILFQGWGI